MVNLQPEGLRDYCRHLHQLFIWRSHVVAWTNWHSGRTRLQIHFHLRGGRQERLAAKGEISLPFSDWSVNLFFFSFNLEGKWEKKNTFSHFTSHSWKHLCTSALCPPESQCVKIELISAFLHTFWSVYVIVLRWWLEAHSSKWRQGMCVQGFDTQHTMQAAKCRTQQITQLTTLKTHTNEAHTSWDCNQSCALPKKWSITK